MDEPRADNGDTGVNRRGDGRAGTPRWVKVFGLVILLLVVLFVILQVATGGEHGPGRHSGASDPPAEVSDAEHRLPPGVDDSE